MPLDLNVMLGLNSYAESASTDAASIQDADLADDDAAVVSPINLNSSPRVSNNGSEDMVADEQAVSPPAENVEADEVQPILMAEMETKLQRQAVFGTLEQARLFYCEYGRQKGFSVRRGDQRYIGKTEQIRWKDFVCHYAGLTNRGIDPHSVRSVRRQQKRSKCLAKIRVYPIQEGAWEIRLFIQEHNHPLLSPDQSYLARSSRFLSEARLGVIQSMNGVGIPVHKACGFIEVECGGAGNVGHIRKDAYNKLHNLKKEMRVENGDSIALLEFFNNKTNSEPFFFWRGRYDDDGRLKHVFFRDSRSLSDYEYFGDVLSVDTTYKTNKYGLSCAPFVGFNHHSTTIMFGVGFLSDEKTETFEWLLSVFLESMYGKLPSVVFSDQCKALMNGIDKIFPSSTHRLCQWHINNNAVKHCISIREKDQFKRLWYKCMNWVESEDEFQEIWNEMMEQHVESENAWLEEIYTLRHRWASVFSQNTFTSGMVSTSRSEGTNRVIKSMTKSSTTLFEFAQAYDKVQSRWREVERAEDAASLSVPGQFVQKNDMVTQAATVYTRKIFKKFEHQCTEVFNVVVDWRNVVENEDGDTVLKATRAQYPNARPRTVRFNSRSKLAYCSCHMWEGSGILCRHILKVYQLMDVQLIPEAMILKRWTKNAKAQVFSHQAEVLNRHGDDIAQFLDFQRLLMRGQSEMISASKGCASAQDYLIKMMETTKQGFQAIIHSVPSHAPASEGCKEKQTQFLNPLKVKQKGPSPTKKKDKTPSQRKRANNKSGPGVSTRSRKRTKFDEGPSFSSLDLNISLSQPVVNSAFQPTSTVGNRGGAYEVKLNSTQ